MKMSKMKMSKMKMSKLLKHTTITVTVDYSKITKCRVFFGLLFCKIGIWIVGCKSEVIEKKQTVPNIPKCPQIPPKKP